jgi:preprotein translocase subunit YajC
LNALGACLAHQSRDPDRLYRMTINLLAAAGAGAAAAPPAWISFLPIIGMIAIFWFLIIRPQMKRQKEHQQKVAAMKKGDQVVTAGGLVGKVVKVDDTFVELELGTNVRVKAVKATIGDIIPPGGTPAND